MKINGYLPGSIRPESAKPSPKKGKSTDTETGTVSYYRGSTRDEYIKKDHGILPRFHEAVYGKTGAADMKDTDAGELDERIGKLLLQVGDTPDRVEMTQPVGSVSTTSFSMTLSITEIYRQGFQSEYTVTEAAVSLWRQEYTVINFNDRSSLERLRERVRAGNFSLNPTAEELDACTAKLRQNGLGGEVNWSALGQELGSFVSIQPNDLADSLDYLASRYVAVLDKLGRNYSGEELAAEQKKLERAYNGGADQMIGNYTDQLQKALGLSDDEAQSIYDSFTLLLNERTAAYDSALEQVNGAVARDNPQDVWLQNHDAYIAARLREAVGTFTDTNARYNAKDLGYTGEIVQAYNRELEAAASGARDEADLALNIAMVDMKVETMIQQGYIGEEMSVLLRSTRAQSQTVILDAADQRMAYRESARLSGEVSGSFASMDRDLFSGIYNAVMGAFNNSGNVSGAIQAGAAYGQAATAQAGAEHPEVLRWSQPMENYWRNFYTTPEETERSELEREIDDLLAEIGQSRSAVNSTYQNYMNSWDNFVTSLDRADEGLPVWF